MIDIPIPTSGFHAPGGVRTCEPDEIPVPRDVLRCLLAAGRTVLGLMKHTNANAETVRLDAAVLLAEDALLKGDDE